MGKRKHFNLQNDFYHKLNILAMFWSSLWSKLSLLGAETAVGAEKACLDLALCPAQWYSSPLQFLDP